MLAELVAYFFVFPSLLVLPVMTVSVAGYFCAKLFIAWLLYIALAFLLSPLYLRSSFFDNDDTDTRIDKEVARMTLKAEAQNKLLAQNGGLSTPENHAGDMSLPPDKQSGKVSLLE